ncbi:hypothetical protein BXY75_2699 [Ulvibacter antarcticus]|uniref:Uncharacterized protein n=1 Tax=Ulvibacter antarcticus TaxID=442714 RepID=A0A3L9YTT4_9FLAO|nr:hypothetical protein BXY75_2699 [Ulvibacter antarcticus]
MAGRFYIDIFYLLIINTYETGIVIHDLWSMFWYISNFSFLLF